MEEINNHIQSAELKIAKLNNFIALSLRRSKISKELEQLSLSAVTVRDLMVDAHELLQKEYNSVCNDYNEVMTQMRRKQMVLMQYMLKEKQRKLKEAEENKPILQLNSAMKVLSAIQKSAVKLSCNDLARLNLNNALCVTPKITISQYKDSPLIKKRVNAIPFHFEEFDFCITQQQFNKIPKYMCGRETLDQLNTFLETVITPCFNEKYQLIYKERSCVRNSNDLELWKLYNEQASSLPGRNFITDGDITRKLNKMLDKKTQNRLVMLRHIGIVQEVRVKQTVCYIWCGNSSNLFL